MISAVLASVILRHQEPEAHWSDGVSVVVLVSADQTLQVNHTSLKALRTIQEERSWEVYKPQPDVAFILDTDSTGIAMSKGLSEMADEVEATGALGPKSAEFVMNIGAGIYPKEKHAKLREQGTGAIGFGSLVAFKSGTPMVLASPIAKPSAPVRLSDNPTRRVVTINKWSGYLSARTWGIDTKKNAEYSAKASAWATNKIVATTIQNEFSIAKLCWVFKYEGYNQLRAQEANLKTAEDLIPLFPLHQERLTSLSKAPITLITPAIEIRISIPGETGLSFYIIR